MAFWRLEWGDEGFVANEQARVAVAWPVCRLRNGLRTLSVRPCRWIEHLYAYVQRGERERRSSSVLSQGDHSDKKLKREAEIDTAIAHLLHIASPHSSKTCHRRKNYCIFACSPLSWLQIHARARDDVHICLLFGSGMAALRWFVAFLVSFGPFNLRFSGKFMP